MSKPKWNEENRETENKTEEINTVGEGMTDEDIERLRTINPNAVFFTLIDNNSVTATNNNVPDVSNLPVENNSEKIPENIRDLIKKMGLDIDDVEKFLCSFFTDENCKILESNTRGQAKNELWFSQRCGRITSSRFGDVFKRKTWSDCFIDSFINSRKINTKATTWGRNHEKKALEAYRSWSLQNHSDVTISESGLFVLKEVPYLGASPDALVACSCCGKGLVEIKCPFKHRNVLPEEAAANDLKFCLNPNLELKNDHNYHYQIQGQLLITKREYCDLIVWTTKGFTISRITISKDCESEEQLLQKLKEFFFHCLVPKLKNE